MSLLAASGRETSKPGGDGGLRCAAGCSGRLCYLVDELTNQMGLANTGAVSARTGLIYFTIKNWRFAM